MVLVLRRLERITKRKNNLVFLSEEQYFTIADLDEEKIFSVPGVIDYKVYVDKLQLVREMNVSRLDAWSPIKRVSLPFMKG